MVALSIMACTHDVSAHTSYLFIVKDRCNTDCISLISSAQKTSTPVLKRAAHYICLRKEPSTYFHQTFPFPGRSDVKRTRIIGRENFVSTVVLKIIEISFSKPANATPKAPPQADHNHPETLCFRGFERFRPR